MKYRGWWHLHRSNRRSGHQSIGNNILRLTHMSVIFSSALRIKWWSVLPMLVAAAPWGSWIWTRFCQIDSTYKTQQSFTVDICKIIVKSERMIDQVERSDGRNVTTVACFGEWKRKWRANGFRWGERWCCDPSQATAWDGCGAYVVLQSLKAWDDRGSKSKVIVWASLPIKTS